jgi:hypothetical protein
MFQITSRPPGQSAIGTISSNYIDESITALSAIGLTIDSQTRWGGVFGRLICCIRRFVLTFERVSEVRFVECFSPADLSTAQLRTLDSSVASLYQIGLCSAFLCLQGLYRDQLSSEYFAELKFLDISVTS